MPGLTLTEPEGEGYRAVCLECDPPRYVMARPARLRSQALWVLLTHRLEAHPDRPRLEVVT